LPTLLAGKRYADPASKGLNDCGCSFQLNDCMKNKRTILKIFLIIVIGSPMIFVGYWTFIIGNVVINDTISNNKIMEENEQKYKKIIHPKETRTLAFKNEIVPPPSTGRQCWFSISELRMIVGSDVKFVNISNQYEALNGGRSPEIISLRSPYDIHKLEQIWNISLTDKKVENLYMVSTLSSGEVDADLRCLFN
jgi:hypothetical protein